MTWEEETVFVRAGGLLEEPQRRTVVFDDQEAAQAGWRAAKGGGKPWTKAHVIDLRAHGLPRGYTVRVVSGQGREAALRRDGGGERVQGTAVEDTRED